LTILFGLLAGHFFGLVPLEVAGVGGVFVGVNASYISAAVLMNAMYGRWILPIGLFSRK
jgi:succinate-acetate transporter protein